MTYGRKVRKAIEMPDVVISLSKTLGIHPAIVAGRN